MPRFIRRGRASHRKVDLDDSEDSDYEELASDIEEDELREWLSSVNFKTYGLVPGKTLVRKFLPPGTIADLYQHYTATQALLGGYTVSSFDCCMKCFLAKSQKIIKHDYV